MCVTCGCSEEVQVAVVDESTSGQRTMSSETAYAHGHIHAHEGDNHCTSSSEHLHSHDGSTVATARARTIDLGQEILGKNQLIAERNRNWLAAKRILALNLVSSPGSGKTTLLEHTLWALKNEFEIGVIEGDQETINDAERIRATGCKAVQINTGTGCHLEADMLERGLKSLDPSDDSLLFIENVGNLVCPALFDLGEHAKIAILSVTEGEDKPLKYPHMFRACKVMILNKIDLLPYVKFDLERSISYAREVNPEISVLKLSATTGEGCDEWHQWLRNARNNN